uniref:uncharacterized protein isoform X2 n=1 Tax=Myxine glutinosa TaxID=7769 RepID=UPI00358EE866
MTEALVFGYALTFLLCVSLSTSCVKVTSCSCRSSRGLLDLSPLASDKGPRFPHAFISNRSYISYNPCIAFTNDTCKRVAMCKFFMGLHETVGSQKSARFIENDDEISILYGTVNWGAKLVLRCIPHAVNSALKVLKTDVSNRRYILELSSKYACLKHEGLNAGSIIAIVLAVIVAVYLFGGMSYMKCVHDAHGLQLIPHVEFWRTLPERTKAVALCAVHVLCWKPCWKPGYSNLQV